MAAFNPAAAVLGAEHTRNTRSTSSRQTCPLFLSTSVLATAYKRRDPSIHATTRWLPFPSHFPIPKITEPAALTPSITVHTVYVITEPAAHTRSITVHTEQSRTADYWLLFKDTRGGGTRTYRATAAQHTRTSTSERGRTGRAGPSKTAQRHRPQHRPEQRPEHTRVGPGTVTGRDHTRPRNNPGTHQPTGTTQTTPSTRGGYCTVYK